MELMRGVGGSQSFYYFDSSKRASVESASSLIQYHMLLLFIHEKSLIIRQPNISIVASVLYALLIELEIVYLRSNDSPSLGNTPRTAISDPMSQRKGMTLALERFTYSSA